jgi:hypothetical protein
VHLTHNTGHPFVTWQRNINEDSTYWGHYFENYTEAEADFIDRAVRLHGQTRRPFNLTAHYGLVFERFMLVQHEDTHEGPAWDEYVCPDYRIAVERDGTVTHHQPRDQDEEFHVPTEFEAERMHAAFERTNALHDAEAYNG